MNLKEWKEANRIRTYPNITRLHQLKAFIPNIFLKRTGIVFDVPEYLSEEELFNNYKTPGNNIPIEKIERIMYWDNEKKNLKKNKKH